ncbi:flagellar protein export ATPase FliI [Gluconacetobacter azotocaptans]|uniref:flagellar protein export ATPase FliI n=1 Tax=Gluconacetobacter azotocaptans TaxID=142834 RepID=UPI0016050BBE|nr:flagellar protein export ATPase FliI [Gluconacetobacter azotocaptans]MBM9401183.1 flagellar protein export ATPase FliI [Gluconacetobacter azotocaptans]GBQ34554.1 flagellum-specific ATP synthase [Gluconacetobacter azotocaptans DSM 13594]
MGAASDLPDILAAIRHAVAEPRHDVPVGVLEGRVTGLSGLSVSLSGLRDFTGVGDRVTLFGLDGRETGAEIVAFRDDTAIAMPYGSLEGIGSGCRAIFHLFDQTQRRRRAGGTLSINGSWQGRVVDPMGRPIDGKGPLPPDGVPQRLHAPPPDAALRARLGPRIDLGVRALNLFTTCREGQRLGLFAGSGVGKSTLMGMLARNTDCDVAVIALVGERGREVREFVEDDLGPDGLAKSVVVVATSDTSPLMRREAAYAAMAAAEYFRDQGKSVLMLMDSVTRFCQALREIGLSSGEPPATRGYPPSVFAELPRLLERAGPGPVGPNGTAGQITAMFSVLVEGDDHNEPIADAVRGILDGHVVLERRIAEAGRYPAINVLRSLSRTVPGCNAAEENILVQEARADLATWEEMQDMVRLGAYRAGNDPKVDKAVHVAPAIEDVLKQSRGEKATIAESFDALRGVLSLRETT